MGQAQKAEEDEQIKKMGEKKTLLLQHCELSKNLAILSGRGGGQGLRSRGALLRSCDLLMVGSVRLRLVFEKGHLLSSSQRQDGLRRSWMVLKSNHDTIFELSSYIIALYRLHDACPDGLILSMDGFVLPPFESTSILKDKEIVSVKKKGSHIHRLENERNCIELKETEEKQSDEAGVRMLANEEFEKDSDGYKSEKEDDVLDQFEDASQLKEKAKSRKVSNKRKALKVISGSKKKKSKHASNKECSVNSTDVQHAHTTPDEENVPLDTNLAKKTKVLNEMSSSADSESPKCSTPEVNGQCNGLSKSGSSVKRLNRFKDRLRGVDLLDPANGSLKLPSRSARRKKAKRLWLRERVKAKKEVLQQDLVKTVNQQAPQKDERKIPDEEQPVEDTDSDVEDDTVPIVIRPGHIRFEPITKVNVNQAVEQNQNPWETIQWNGITSKKRGQKWGKENSSSGKWKDYESYKHDAFSQPTTESEPSPNATITFEKLRSCTSTPKACDVIAYKLIELSLSWTPELSSFRVGKVSWYDPNSNKIMLISLPEYPFAFKKEIDETSAVQPVTTPYGEDGSLKIDYSSLVDVRIVKEGNSNRAGEGSADNQSVETRCHTINENGESSKPAKNMHEDGKVCAWDEISQALSAKKAQLSHEDDRNIEERTGKRSWSNRTLRGSALGPTVALLRAQNEL